MLHIAQMCHQILSQLSPVISDQQRSYSVNQTTGSPRSCQLSCGLFPSRCQQIREGCWTAQLTVSRPREDGVTQVGPEVGPEE